MEKDFFKGYALNGNAELVQRMVIPFGELNILPSDAYESLPKNMYKVYRYLLGGATVFIEGFIGEQCEEFKQKRIELIEDWLFDELSAIGAIADKAHKEKELRILLSRYKNKLEYAVVDTLIELHRSTSPQKNLQFSKRRLGNGDIEISIYKVIS